MADIVFPGVSNFESGLTSILGSKFGIQGRVVGNDYVIPHAAANAALSKEVFKIHPQIALAPGDEAAIASRLAAQVPNDLKRYKVEAPDRVYLSKDYGLITEVETAATHIAIVDEVDVERTLAEEIIPLMMKHFNSSHVTAVTIDSDRQQAWISISKILMLASQYQPQEAERRMRRGVLDGILPGALRTLSFVDALTRLSPIAFTLPLYRHGCAWHFQTSAMWSIPNAAANGIVPLFLQSLSPLADSVHQFGLDGLEGMSQASIWRYLRFVVIGLNRLMRFLNDPRSFTPTGRVDLIKQIQAYGAMHLLFADLLAINLSTTSHNRISYAFSAMDKIANFRVQLGDHSSSYTEENAMAALASISQASELKRLLRVRMEELNYAALYESAEGMIDRCYGNLHTQLAQQDPEGTRTEANRLERLRSQRNLRHGTFLRKKQQFEALFLNSAGTIPDTIGTLPLLLTLGFICDPRAFINFRPQCEAS